MTKAKQGALYVGLAASFFISDIFLLGQSTARNVNAGWVMETVMGGVHVAATICMIVCAYQVGVLSREGAE